MSARCCTKAAANASEAASMAVCARPLSPPKPDIQSPKRASRSASVMGQGSALWKYLQKGVPKKGAKIPNVSEHDVPKLSEFLLISSENVGGGIWEYFFFNSALRNFLKERTCPDTIEWKQVVEHAVRRLMHLCCNASTRICKRYGGFT